jgi:hypothetical protein
MAGQNEDPRQRPTGPSVPRLGYGKAITEEEARRLVEQSYNWRVRLAGEVVVRVKAERKSDAVREAKRGLRRGFLGKVESVEMKTVTAEEILPK